MANNFTVSGSIINIGPTQEIPSKRDGGSPYTKRQFTIDIQERDPAGMWLALRYPSTPTFELSGDRCSMLDTVNVGTHVTVSFELSGRSYVKDGETRYFTSLRAWNIINEDTAAVPAVANQAPPAVAAPAPSPLATPPLMPGTADPLPF